MRRSPVFLRTKSMGCPYGDIEGLIQPLFNKSSIYRLHSANSSWLILYTRGLAGYASSSIRSIAWSIVRFGGIEAGSNTSWNSEITLLKFSDYPLSFWSPLATRNKPNQLPFVRFYLTDFKIPFIPQSSTLVFECRSIFG